MIIDTVQLRPALFRALPLFALFVTQIRRRDVLLDPWQPHRARLALLHQARCDEGVHGGYRVVHVGAAARVAAAHSAVVSAVARAELDHSEVVPAGGVVQSFEHVLISPAVVETGPRHGVPLTTAGRRRTSST
jgi:hypothetical protein